MDHTGGISGDRVPEAHFTVAKDLPCHLETPHLGGIFFEPQLRKGNFHLSTPAPIINFTLRLPDRVPAEILVLTIVGKNLIEADPGSAHTETEAGTKVM